MGDRSCTRGNNDDDDDKEEETLRGKRVEADAAEDTGLVDGCIGVGEIACSRCLGGGRESVGDEAT